MAGRDSSIFDKELDEHFYDWKHRKLGLPDFEKGLKKKFIAIQIDALPFAVLEQLLNTRHCPFLTRMITDKHYFISRYNCGLPSDTPTVTAGLFYQNSKKVIGFRYIDKKKKKICTFAEPGVAFEMEQELKKNKRGILTGGSAFVSTYSGGAKRTFLTMSTFTNKGPLKRVKESNIIVVMLLNPWVLGRVIWTSSIELLLELYDSFRTFLHRAFVVKEKKAGFKFIFPFKRFFYQGFVLELQRIGAIWDMKRGVPRIYLNFHSYDDIIHRRGIDSAASRRVLRQIDKTIERIYRQKPEEYDFYVFSDHGAEDSTPFDVLYDESLAYLLHRVTKAEIQESEDDEGWSARLRLGAKRLATALKYVTGPVRWTLKILLKILSKEFRKRETEMIWKDKEQIFIQQAGSLAHIYFNVSKRRLELKDIKRRYPKLIPELRKHPGIGMIVIKDKDHTRIIGWDGEFIVDNRLHEGKVRIINRKGSDFLRKFGKTDVILRQIRSLSNRKNVGDMILLGNYHDGKIVSFGHYFAAHGGLGKQMCAPFFISKQGFDLRNVTDPDELYNIFKMYL